MTQILKITDLDFKYHEDDEALLLKNINLEIEKNSWVAILGANGSGKSTLAKLINGLEEKTAGSIKVLGDEITEENLWDIRATVGMVFQNPENQFVGATVEDDVAFGLENNGVEHEVMVMKVRHALELVKMTEFMTREPSSLSGGQKQRVAIASVLARNPKLLILDEATSMLDPEGKREVLSCIRKIKEIENLTVISITHDLEEAKEADRAIVLKQGEIYTDTTPSELFCQTDLLDEMGLDLPNSEKLIKALRDSGVDISCKELSENALKESLWTLYSRT
ncbi:MAG: energy-coupling factor transporter ATPase [Lactobacillales bacterium]|jgi:energy-coupling factor transport system ATP-binding protein|nr:energy-coupling factor transporter ATPase [Lactobacillales bacterium]